ncbi:hypothetical protein F5I97DRAFT_1994977 [Phlebopus sp. FC_14]|nr:hypothetical protein F5I97DRAFT_1994977 [Phlebopus sp. FC_14]
MQSRGRILAQQDSRSYHNFQPYADMSEDEFYSPVHTDPGITQYYQDFETFVDEIDSSPSPVERSITIHRPVYQTPSSLGHRVVGRQERRQYGCYAAHVGPEWVPGAHVVHDASSGLPLSAPHSRAPGSGRDHIQTGANPRNSFGLRLRPVSDLPDRFRGVFKFGVFNAVQSTCFDKVLYSQDNLVISAPTGSGKTVLFELAIIGMLMDAKHDLQSSKCIYVAPTKALCTEKCKEWTAKLGGLGVKCCELTGDTLLLGKGIWGDAKNAQVVVTTAEKWDSLTRNWDDHFRILSQIRLFLVHILNESRGSILEVVVSRMKARGSAIRFLLVSATVPNIEDVASWIGSNHDSNWPATIFQFGEEFRPCKLTKLVYAVAKPKGQNDFAYAHTIDCRLFSVLQRHSAKKPILIFCPTRKGTVATAKQLAKDYEQALKAKQALPWSPPPRIDRTFHDKGLAPLAAMGIAVHHAGLTIDDRKVVEELYIQKTLRVLVATSTLAVGVNLPAHLVVIKGVKLYQNGEMREYSDLDVVQMMGRAGRPQFDAEGIAIILCETELEHKYRALAQGTTTLESRLHENLTEHLNSEIGLGTISNVETAKDWIRRSFLFRRIQKNPQHYDIGKEETQTWQEKIDEVVIQSIYSLRETRLITFSERDGGLCSTEYGDIMSKFYIRQSTMRCILGLPSSASIREILEMISCCEELADLKLRGGEKQLYEKIRRLDDIRFPPKKVSCTSDKIFLLIQAVLAGLSLNNPEFKAPEGQPYLEAVSIFRHVSRIATGETFDHVRCSGAYPRQAVAEVAIVNHSGAQAKHALELVRCLNAKTWEDRPLVLRQIEHIGEKSVKYNKILAENGITSIQKLRQTLPLCIEELLNRRPPFGFEVIAAVNEFPKYFLNLKELRYTPSNGNTAVEVELCIECGVSQDTSVVQRVKKPRRTGTQMTTLLTVTSDFVFVDFRRIATKALREKKEFTLSVQLMKPSQAISVYIASEKIAGITVTATYKPAIAPDKYPILDTRPLTSVEMDLEGLEDVPGFWDMELTDEDAPVTDLTKARDRDVNGPKPNKSRPLRLGSPAVQPKELRERKRPDGKYDCNHSCKNKSRCRHYCCNEGLSEPPRVSRKKELTNTEDLPTAMPKSCSTKEPSVGFTHPPRSSQLVPVQLPGTVQPSLTSQQVHANVEVSPNFKRAVVQCLDTNEGKRPKKVPNFDLELTTLTRSSSPAFKTMLTNGSYGDDELPTISELLEKEKSSQSETDYTDAEVDAMIRDMPLDSLSAGNGRKRERAQQDKSRSVTPPILRSDTVGSVLYCSGTLYNGKFEQETEGHAAKRPRTKSTRQLFGQPPLLLEDKTSMPVQYPDDKLLMAPLFLHLSEDEDAMNSTRHVVDNADIPISDCAIGYENDFYLDKTYFDVTTNSGSEIAVHPVTEWSAKHPSSSEWSRDDASTHRKLHDRSPESIKDMATHMPWREEMVPELVDLSSSRITDFPQSDPDESHSQLQNDSEFGFAGRTLRTSAASGARTHIPITQGRASDTRAQLDDPLAEFDRWLASGAVDIIAN